jgi:phage protein D
MPNAPLRDGLPQSDYYAPEFKIQVEGKDVAPEVLREILDVKVVMDMQNMTSFDFTIANPWHYKDPEGAIFKYSDSTLFDLGNLVHIEMGYADRLLPMMAGIITKLTPKFPESGPPTILVTGQDRLIKLRDRKPKKGEVKYYTQKHDYEIAEVIAKRNNLKVEVTREGPQHPIVVQRNQDDAAFLMERAKRIDFDCYIDVNPKTKKDTLYFVKPTDGRGTSQRLTYVFQWGKSLRSFTPELTAARQVSRVTVKGWNPKKKEKISYTATKSDLDGKKSAGTSGPAVAEAKLDKKEEVVVDWPVQTLEEAKALAISLLRERAYEFLQASGEAIGLPDMRPGDNVEIKDIGLRFSGQYYVTRVEHAIGNNGYTTSFTVRRSWDGGTKKAGGAA